MDKKIEKPSWKKKWPVAVIGILIVGLLIVYAYRMLTKESYRLDRSRMTTSTVQEMDFQDIILIDGTVEPITSVLVNTPEGGTVEELFAEDGVPVRKGDPLVRLDNPSLLLSYMTQETAIVEQINNLRNLKLSLEREERNLEESLIDTEYELTRNERQFKTDTVLYAQSVLAVNDFKDTYNEYRYRVTKRDFLEDQFQATSINNRDQIQRINKSINLMERNLDVIHANMDKLLVRAPVSGMLSSFNPVIGEAFNGRQTIAKIDVQEGFKIRGQVDEYYLSRVRPGLKATFAFSGEAIELEIMKVLPEVEGGDFAVEMKFTGEVPDKITTGQSLQIKLQLSATSQAVVIPRGSYYQTSGGRYVFVLVEDGKAIKRPIRIGRQNPTYYEVLEGLSAGETFITSSYDLYKNFETVEIKN